MRSAVIGSLAGDSNIMRMALGNTGISDAGKFSRMKFVDINGTTITHTGTKSAEHLINHLVKRALEWNSGGYALRHKFAGVGFSCLEITVLGTLLHRCV